MSDPIREDLVAHLREQIERDPEAYANDAKLRAALSKVREGLDLESLGVAMRDAFVLSDYEERAIRANVAVGSGLGAVVDGDVMDGVFYWADMVRFRQLLLGLVVSGDVLVSHSGDMDCDPTFSHIADPRIRQLVRKSVQEAAEAPESDAE